MSDYGRSIVGSVVGSETQHQAALKNYTIAARAEPGRKRERERRDWQETAVLGEREER
jgi:hypothetical protein